MRRLAWVVWVALMCTACATMHPASRPQSALGHRSALGGVTQVFPADHRSPAPRLRGTTLDGATLDLADQLGRGPVAVNVWASWCGPCRREVPVLTRASAGIRVIGIDERDRGASARSFAAAQEATYPSWYDPDGTLLARLPMLPQVGVPSTLFLDRDGRVAARVVGSVDAGTLRRIVHQLGGSR